MSTTYALQLHLEIKDSQLESIDTEDAQVLRKYGNVESAISRDVIVPSTLALHQLHYLINVAFGWGNSHLHNFQLPKKQFTKLTEGKIIDIAPVFGYYLNFPNDKFSDTFWDDDYDESKSFRTWMRSKYNKNYRYRGHSEYWVENQVTLLDLAEQLPVLNVQSFSWKDESKPRKVMFKDATLDDLMNAIMFDLARPEQLKESLRLSDILSLAPTDIKTAKAAALSRDGSMVSDYKYHRDIVISINEQEDRGGPENILFYKSLYKVEDILKNAEPKGVLPITSELHYEYDYGDDWEVCITLVREFGKDGDIVDDERAQEVISTRKPLCVAKDGLNVLDDVGGIGGYINMLRTLHEGEKQEIQETKEWVRSQGWTGKDLSPEKVL